jgi:hypothetical protein
MLLSDGEQYNDNDGSAAAVLTTTTTIIVSSINNTDTSGAPTKDQIEDTQHGDVKQWRERECQCQNKNIACTYITTTGTLVLFHASTYGRHYSGCGSIGRGKCHGRWKT